MGCYEWGLVIRVLRGLTYLAPNYKGADKDESNRCEEDDCRDHAHGFEHLDGKWVDLGKSELQSCNDLRV